ncbi:hypothetical protein F0562_034220 [Nyssa sinensis]|uniref:Uncharacterized protein n=1 Tax=Nyssa sinensis TaxID=561372 RepID=A0A5J5AGF1_9ASTE|nr:hypothetical protein F0562_034220 [Nyssa sinensis]
MAGLITNSRSCPLLSAAASATIAISLAEACGVDMNPGAAKPPSPSPMMIPLLRIRLIWLRAGWRMLKSTQAMAGIMGNKRARPRLSPSAISAICCAAKAGSQELKVEKMAPAMAVPASEVVSDGFEVHLALSIAIVAMVAAIDVALVGLVETGFQGLVVMRYWHIDVKIFLIVFLSRESECGEIWTSYSMPYQCFLSPPYC